MFYSHQLLARKAPLGQIWMAATMHAKMNRRKLDKLDIIKICEEILNPSVPMALRLSGILMGGVVIVYERKVKLLYDDVTRLVMEINEAWKVKVVADRTVLPKGKNQAKFDDVTLPANIDMEDDQAMHFSDTSSAAAKFQRMHLDDLDLLYININPQEDDFSEHHHQAEAANITLYDDFTSGVGGTDFYNHFERFDIEGDEETQMFFTSQEPPQAPSTLIPSPPQVDHAQVPTNHIPSSPPHNEPREDAVINAQVPEEQREKESRNDVEEKQTVKDSQRRKSRKRKVRGDASHVVIDEQIMIPGSVYQSWLQDTSNILSRGGRKLQPFNPILSRKISNLMELPPLALISALESTSGEVTYPAPLMELWRKSTERKPQLSSSSDTLPEEPRQEASKSPPERSLHPDLPEFPLEDFQSHMGSQSLGISIERLRANLENMDFREVSEALLGGHTTPGTPGQSPRSHSSSGSGHAFMQMEPEIQLPSARSKRKQHSSSRSTLGSLDPVEEEFPLQQSVRDLKLRRLSENGPTPDFELMEETAPTQTPPPVISDPSLDKITQSIRTHLKLHFDTPGAPLYESLNQLASGMNRRKAAQLFYQTCVLATCDFVKVYQGEAYGDISISRGPKM